MMPRFFLALLLVSLANPVIPADAANSLNVHELLDNERLSQIALSPDGTQLAFTVRTTDVQANKGRTDLWLVGTDGKGMRQLTTHEASDHSAAWSPDGKALYFLSARTGKTQVHKLPLTGGEARQITDLPLSVTDLRVSPDGRNLAYSLKVFPDCEDLDCTAERLEDEEARAATGQVYDEIFIRHWDEWKDGRLRQLFLQEATFGATPRRISAGVHGDIPSNPWGGTEEYCFSPGGEGIVFTARQSGPNEPTSTNFDLYWVALDGGGSPQLLTAPNKAWDTQPTFSPDGSKLAWLAMQVPDYEADRFRIQVADARVEGGRLVLGEPKSPVEGWDRSPGSLAWGPDGRNFWAHAQDLGHRSLFSIDTKSGEARRVFQDGTVRQEIVGQREVFFLRDHMSGPAEIHAIRHDGSRWRQITDMNGSQMAGVALGEAEQFRFTGANEDEVYGWVMKPANYRAGERYPVAFLIHGGPQGSFGNGWSYRWNPQTYAGAGYAVVMIDFHGSVGYGQEFTDSIAQNWGGWPLQDLQIGLDHALNRYDFLDGDRVAGLGASYGGYMVNWIAGNWSDRFRCLVNHDGIFDMRFGYYSTEELWFFEKEVGGTAWERTEIVERWNPVNHVEKWKTPMLVIHSALDYRLSYEHGVATFTALQRQGIPSRFLYFPDENHWVLKPQNSIQWHGEVLRWLDQWMKEPQGQ